MWLFLLVAAPDLLDGDDGPVNGQAPINPGPVPPVPPVPPAPWQPPPHAPMPGWPLPQPVPPPAAPQPTFPTQQAKQPFGPNAIIQGEDLAVIEANGFVFMPYVDSIVLAGTDVDVWPSKLTVLAPDIQAIIVQAQQAIVDGELPCRIKGGCEPQAMANLLYKWSGITSLTRAQFVAFHLFLTVMARKSGGLSIAQAPNGPEQTSWSAAALAVAEGTLLNPQQPAFS